ncbi:MAG: cell division protein FtsA [Candidatus Campbellbacteria bacterium]|nr:cell division protein FtsA [Candidatus Campbellbacteria bacterium]
MTKNIAVGIDIGTYNVKVAIAEKSVQNGKVVPRLIATGFAESKGLRHGYIINSSEAVKSIRKAVKQAEKTAGVEVGRAYVSMGGISLEGNTSVGSTVITHPDMEISEEDAQAALNASERTLPRALTLNKKILHTIPIQYKIDGRDVLGRPNGMRGSKLEVKSLFITCLEQHLNDLIQAVEDVGIEVEDVVAAPIAASFVSLTKTQKIAGCVLANIGAETVSIVVYENSIPISLEVFPSGSNDITNDIALGLKVPIEEAEKIKLGHATGVGYPKDQIEGIVAERLKEIFLLVEAHLSKIGKNELLPAGIIISGGGSGLGSVQEIAKATLDLPSMIARSEIIYTSRNQIKDATWSVAYGLCILDFSTESESKSRGSGILKRIGGIFRWLKQFLP